MAPEASNFTESSRIDELCLPTLDDLLADSSDTDPGGLFSGFQCLNNGDLSMHSDDDLAAHQCSCAGIHSCCPDLYSSSDNEQSSITPQATAQGLPPAALPQQQQHSATAKSKAAPHHALPPKHTQPTPPTQPDMPSLAGLTAAQVANAIGFTGQPDNAKPASVLPCGQLPGTEKSAHNPARGNRKRSRDLDSTGITPTTGTGPSSSTAGHSVADPVASRSGSPDVSSSNAGTSGQELRQQSSSQDSAEPDEEQKRQVCTRWSCLTFTICLFPAPII